MEFVHKNLTIIHRSCCLYLSVLCSAFLIALVCLDVLQAGLRYLADTSLPWAVDVTLLLLQAFAWSSAVFLWLSKGHIVVDFFSNRFQFTRHFWLPANLVLCVGVVWLLPDTLVVMKVYNDMVMPALPASASIRVLPMLFGLVLLGLAALLNTLLFLSGSAVHESATQDLTS